MASEMADQMKPLTEFYAKWSKDALEMMSKGLGMYDKMIRAWTEVGGQAQAEQPEDTIKKWADAFGGSYKDLFEMYTQPFKMFGAAGEIPGKEAWQDAFSKWQKMFTAMPSGSTPTSGDEFMNFSKHWFEGYSKVWQAWMESMQTMGEACKAAVSEGENPDAAMGAFTEISDKFMQQWAAFVTDQAQAFFSLWRSRLPDEKTEPKRPKKA
ncbi:MAG: hypothetical protein QM256_08915 [Pseudomonadota bacterium]|jgi:hypothetical protein|nr:hypothetical protein [Syntrophaceae bacterium]MBP7034097.1 hypothetical protein [Syntrophobacterales bacterium]MDI9555886.1 hypothetical protein [Pseudomonadota bacterium]NLX31082.1 hypothetical protein [Deltaproteobacteria bacterium]HNU85200.1 hypothetical protein [Syntrophales bacterium]